MTTVDKDQYNTISSQYDSIEDLPQMKLCYNYVEAALGDCTGQTMLDLGGGTGFHARQSIEHGMKYVDVVDISEGMMENGKAIESQLGRSDVLRWHHGDISKPLDHLPLDEQYDIVLVGWTFDHAETDEDLEGMWKNTSAYCKPGGRLISVQMESCSSPASRQPRFGVVFSDEEKIQGGIKYVYHAQTNPVMSCPATTMDASLDFEKSKQMAKKYGFVDYERVPTKKMDIVKADPGFWELFLEGPTYRCVTAIRERS